MMQTQINSSNFLKYTEFHFNIILPILDISL
jgi:hypothetical protein